MINKSEYDGYTTNFCMECTNSYQTVKADNLVIIQDAAVPWTTIIWVVVVVFTIITCAVMAAYNQNRALKLRYEERRRPYQVDNVFDIEKEDESKRDMIEESKDLSSQHDESGINLQGLGEVENLL